MFSLGLNAMNNYFYLAFQLDPNKTIFSLSVSFFSLSLLLYSLFNPCVLNVKCYLCSARFFNLLYGWWWWRQTHCVSDVVILCSNTYEKALCRKRRKIKAKYHMCWMDQYRTLHENRGENCCFLSIYRCVCDCNSVSRRKLKIYFSFTLYDRWKWYWYIMPLICDMLVVIFVLAACHYLFTLLACSQCMLYSLMRLNSKKDRHHEAWPLIFSYWSAWHALKEKNERKYLKENHVNPLNSIWIWRKKAFYTI